ncbi:MAG: nuclear transport factor 2 family protein [Proteobacteria bacterium]|nr:nuclear transport factor 2 family protein [Pseudomonadota bacterium]
MNLKELARQYFTAVNCYDVEAVRNLVHPNYIQHNPYLATGRQPFLDFLPKLSVHRSRIENIRILQDKNYVIMHHLWHNAEPFGASEMVAFHIIRFDESVTIAEHWNVVMPNIQGDLSGRTMFDGVREVSDIEKTESNRAVVAEFMQTLIGVDSQSLESVLKRFVRQDLIQHSPHYKDGIEGWSQFFLDVKNKMSYARIHRVFAEGCFVVVVSDAIVAGKNCAIYDLFRLANGQIAEHWDVMQEIPAGKTANDNTMFSFDREWVKTQFAQVSKNHHFHAEN